jgi:hypothetical protein
MKMKYVSVQRRCLAKDAEQTLADPAGTERCGRLVHAVEVDAVDRSVRSITYKEMDLVARRRQRPALLMEDADVKR